MQGTEPVSSGSLGVTACGMRSSVVVLPVTAVGHVLRNELSLGVRWRVVGMVYLGL
jgi:hypothetical protein